MTQGELAQQFLGGELAADAPLSLRAGPLSLLYENGGLRYIRLCNREIVRRIYSAVRDANWSTVPDEICNLHTDIYNDSFHLEFDVVNRQREIDFAWHGTIVGESTGRIVFEINGQAKSTFRKNRIGFCVLHPAEIAGTPVQVFHADEAQDETRFPRFIAADNPFLNVTGLRHAVQPGVDVELTFEGDIFETEDQRNWIDASFKSFCTPLSRPRPVEIQAGERVFQRVTIQLHGELAEHGSHDSAGESAVGLPAVKLELASQPVGSLPRIGFTLPPDAPSLTARQIERLRLLQPSHLRCELRLANDVAQTLQQAIAAAAALGAPLELALYIGAEPDQELAALIQLVNRLKPPVTRWTVFPAAGWSTTRELVERAREHLRDFDPEVPIGGGTPANFRELNCQRPPTDLMDFVTWSVTPQIHAFDNWSLVETLAAHSATVESARQFAGELPLVVGPVTLKMQVNPYATGAWPPPTPAGQLPPRVDVRQMSLFAAGWTLGSIKYLAESGVHAATYYDLVGWQGLMERESGSLLLDQFPSLPGCVFPLYHVFADLAELTDPQVLQILSSDPLRIDGLALSSGPLTRILVANLTGQPQFVALAFPATAAKVRVLDQRNVLGAMRDPAAYRMQEISSQPIAGDRLTFELWPYALARIDLT